LSSLETDSRSSGYYNDRLDGVSDILRRSRDCSVLDIGCNRGLVSFQLVLNGASLVHGCDIFEQGVEFARELFKELPAVHRFERIDLTGGPTALEQGFGKDYQSRYDIVLFMAVYQKLLPLMDRNAREKLVKHIADRTGRFLLIRNKREQLDELEEILKDSGLRRVQYSELPIASAPKVIYERQGFFASSNL
jgi:SAM-dependent methyltransferase